MHLNLRGASLSCTLLSCVCGSLSLLSLLQSQLSERWQCGPRSPPGASPERGPAGGPGRALSRLSPHPAAAPEGGVAGDPAFSRAPRCAQVERAQHCSCEAGFHLSGAAAGDGVCQGRRARGRALRGAGRGPGV